MQRYSLSRFRWTEHDIFFKVSSFGQDLLHTCYNWVILGLSSWYLNIYKEVDFDVNKTPPAGFTADEIRGISETKSEMWWVDAIGANQFFLKTVDELILSLKMCVVVASVFISHSYMERKAVRLTVLPRYTSPPILLGFYPTPDYRRGRIPISTLWRLLLLTTISSRDEEMRGDQYYMHSSSGSSPTKEKRHRNTVRASYFYFATTSRQFLFSFTSSRQATKRNWSSKVPFLALSTGCCCCCCFSRRGHKQLVASHCPWVVLGDREMLAEQRWIFAVPRVSF